MLKLCLLWKIIPKCINTFGKTQRKPLRKPFKKLKMSDVSTKKMVANEKSLKRKKNIDKIKSEH
jgi:hypothetical protein